MQRIFVALLCDENDLSEIITQRINSKGSEEEVLNDVFAVTDALMHDDVAAIGIGVPSVVDVEEGIVYDVQYIPSWKEVHLKKAHGRHVIIFLCL